MKKLAAFIVAMVVCSVAFAGNGLLWKISGNGLDGQSYIVGSHHLVPGTFIDSIPGLRDAIGEVDQVCGEIALTDIFASAREMMALAIAPPDSTLSKVLTPEEYAIVDSVMSDVGIIKGVKGVLQMFDGMKPALITNMLSMQQIMKDNPELTSVESFDVSVLNVGKSLSKNVVGLETVEMQTEMLFGGSIAQQARNLMNFIADIDKQDNQNREITEAFFALDLDRIAEIVEADAATDDGDDYDRLLYNRNAAWIPQMITLMGDEPTLFVVGAAHLIGDRGLLQLLRNEGYTVTPVNN